MASLDQLPTELLNHICKHLAPSTATLDISNTEALARLGRTARRYHDITTPYLYSTVDVTNDRLLLLARTLIEHPDLNHLVKTARLSRDEEYSDSELHDILSNPLTDYAKGKHLYTDTGLRSLESGPDTTAAWFVLFATEIILLHLPNATSVSLEWPWSSRPPIFYEHSTLAQEEDDCEAHHLRAQLLPSLHTLSFTHLTTDIDLSILTQIVYNKPTITTLDIYGAQELNVFDTPPTSLATHRKLHISARQGLGYTDLEALLEACHALEEFEYCASWSYLAAVFVVECLEAVSGSLRSLSLDIRDAQSDLESESVIETLSIFTALEHLAVSIEDLTFADGVAQTVTETADGSQDRGPSSSSYTALPTLFTVRAQTAKLSKYTPADRTATAKYNCDRELLRLADREVLPVLERVTLEMPRDIVRKALEEAGIEVLCVARGSRWWEMEEERE